MELPPTGRGADAPKRRRKDGELMPQLTANEIQMLVYLVESRGRDLAQIAEAFGRAGDPAHAALADDVANDYRILWSKLQGMLAVAVDEEE